MTHKERSIRIVIADDHTIFRDGLKTLLSGQPDFVVVGEACDGEEACKLVIELCPHVLLLDFSMPKANGIEVLQLLAQSSSDHSTYTILLSGTLEGEEITAAFELGAHGIVLKDVSTPILFKSIAAVMAGQYWVGRQSYETREAALKQHHQTEKKTPSKYGLTPREMEVLRAAVLGLSNKDIAAQYAISVQTVKHHITSIFDKLGVYNRLELTLFALHHKLVGK